jgi:hypothetical protein
VIASRDSDRPATLEQLLEPGLAARLDRLDVLSRKILSGKLPGERRSKRRGRSVEFDDYRTYVPGDDPRHIDWNVLARLDKLFVKLFREEEDMAVHLVVDASASMDAGRPSKLVFACRVAMALGYLGLVNQNRVLATVFGLPSKDAAPAREEAAGSAPSGSPAPGTQPARPRQSGPIRQLTPLRGRPSVRRLASFLLDCLDSRVRAGPGPDASPARSSRDATDELNDALFTIASRRSARGIVLVLSDFVAPSGCARGLSAMAAAQMGGVDTYCLQVLSPGELDPDKERADGLVGDLRLTDAESSRVAEVTLSRAAISRYKSALSTYNARLRSDCVSRGLAHFLVPSDTPVSRLVLDSLRRGGLLRG